jgi:putative peptidoglycan lipid II flippase
VTPVFYALNDTKTPVRFAAIVIAVKIAVNLALIRQLGFLGLALATSAASLFNAILLMRALEKRIGKFVARAFYLALAKITVASLIMGVAAWQIHLGISARVGLDTLVLKTGALTISISAALGILLLTSALLKIEQASQMIAFVRRRFTRSS